MNYIRGFLYRPKKNDESPMAQFFYADEALNVVAAELDSFDGRRDPDRCASLVHKLRNCQDKLLNVCHTMIEEIEPGSTTAIREFRAKFPDDILHDNLAGQLWFGAECLAAGSSIMNKEIESENMRPLAKAVTKSLERVRTLLREQCRRSNPEYTENIRENLKIFDRLFSEFEFKYVQCMVHVKTVREYELHQDLIILFSNTLMRSIKLGLVTQDMVDYYDPSLMFAIPRLAIVCGLLIQPEGPLNVDRGSAEFPELFLPFRNLLRKIRELLQTLEESEVIVLEMLLCQQEEPANLTAKLKEVQTMLAEKKRQEQAEKLQAKLDSPGGRMRRVNSITCRCDESLASTDIVSPIVEAVISDVVASKTGKVEEKAEAASSARRPKSRSSSSSSSSSTESLKKAKAIAYKFQKDKRGRFKSTEDLLHRLYVCISGAADQLQSNYAGDFRSILKTVFLINSAPDEDAEDESDTAVSGPAPPPVISANDPVYVVDWAADALQNEISDEQLRRLTEDCESNGGDTYVRNLSYVNEDLNDIQDGSSNIMEFYRDEPALMTIASGAADNVIVTEEREVVITRSDYVIGNPPAWIPDEAAPSCMGCSEPFTVFKRRHHCRSCGLVFCFRCSSQSVPLPHYGIDKPVRVCNRCFLFYRRQTERPMWPGTSSSNNGSSGGSGGNIWSRNFGMVS